MEFWNDYEGKTVANFPLQKLLRPEGRSAFFLTSDATGKPASLRLTESINDQDELLSRWQQVSDLAHPSLLAIRSFGSTAYDGVPLTYALMEAPDATLAEILAERPLTPAETTQVGIAIAAALRALHEISFTHDHVSPASVYAVGETIKLRSDCVRECIPDPEFNPEAACLERRQRDIQGLGTVLLQCLTLEKTLAPGTFLPAQFDQLIRHALDGSWSLAQIALALEPPQVKPLVPPAVLAAAHEDAGLDIATHPEPRPMQLTDEELPAQRELPLRTYVEEPYQPSTRYEFPVWARNPRVWGATAVALLLAFLIGHIHNAPSAPPPTITTTAAPAPAKPVVQSPAPVQASVQPNTQTASQPSIQPGWRVIVYTYTKEAQAFAKAAAIQARHPDLQAQVFAQHRHAPFLVSLGGPMSREEAQAVLQKARRAGLPRDSFVRLYNS